MRKKVPLWLWAVILLAIVVRSAYANFFYSYFSSHAYSAHQIDVEVIYQIDEDRFMAENVETGKAIILIDDDLYEGEELTITYHSMEETFYEGDSYPTLYLSDDDDEDDFYDL